jgi:hypothetical protein
MAVSAEYRMDLLHARIRELEKWQAEATEDIARLRRLVISLLELPQCRDLGEVAAMHGLTHVR